MFVRRWERDLANAERQIDHLRGVRALDGRPYYEPAPGSAARPASPYFNDIDKTSKVRLVRGEGRGVSD